MRIFRRFLTRLCAASALSLAALNACAPAQDPNTITFSTWGSPEEMAILRPLVAEFQQQHPDIRVNLLHVPDKYFQKLQSLIAANLAPDVIFVNNINFPLYASNEAFLDLEPYLAQSRSLKAADFYPQTLDGFRWKGQLQGLPRDVSNLVMFYNRELFDKAHLAYPGENWTMEQMLETARRLTVDADKDGHPEQFGVSFQDYFLFWFPYVWSFGGELLNPARDRFTLDQPEATAGLQFYADLRNKYHVAPTAAEAGATKPSQMFMNGKLAMVLNGRWAVPLYRQNLNFKWDIAPFPKGPKGSVVDADASGWVISRRCAHPDKAWQLVEFLAGKQASEAFTRPGLVIPARRDVAQSQVFMAPGQPPARAKVFLDALEQGRPMPAVPYWNAIMDSLSQALEPVWSGAKPANEALKGVEPHIQNLL